MYLILVGSRLLLSLLFFVAGVSKLLGGFANSRKALAEFGVPMFLVAPLSVALPLGELTIGGLLLPSASAWIGAISALSLLLIFNAATAANLAVGKNPSCNCFGQLHSKPIGWNTFARNGVLAGLASGLAWQLRVHPPSENVWPLIQALSATQIALIIVAITIMIVATVQGFLLLHLFRQNGRLMSEISNLTILFWRDFCATGESLVQSWRWLGEPHSCAAMVYRAVRTQYASDAHRARTRTTAWLSLDGWSDPGGREGRWV
jgi:hypothetical protein